MNSATNLRDPFVLYNDFKTNFQASGNLLRSGQGSDMNLRSSHDGEDQNFEGFTLHSASSAEMLAQAELVGNQI